MLYGFKGSGSQRKLQKPAVIRLYRIRLTAMRHTILFSLILLVGICSSTLDDATIQRLFGNFLNAEQAQQLSTAVNSAKPVQNIKKFLSTISDQKLRKKVKQRVHNMRQKDKLLENTYSEMMTGAAQELNETAVDQLEELRESLQQKYQGDFALVLKDVYDKALEMAPSDKLNATKTALNQVLQDFNTQGKLKKLTNALRFFQPKNDTQG